jgi:hypothetical protein
MKVVNSYWSWFQHGGIDESDLRFFDLTYCSLHYLRILSMMY